MNILTTGRTVLLLAALLAAPSHAQELTGPEGTIMAILTSGEGLTSVNGTHADACAVLERAGWRLSAAGEDTRGRAVRLYRDAQGRHSALVWDLHPVRVRVTDGDMALPRNWVLMEE